MGTFKNQKRKEKEIGLKIKQTTPNIKDKTTNNIFRTGILNTNKAVNTHQPHTPAQPPGPGRKGELLYLRMGGVNEAQVRKIRTTSRETSPPPPTVFHSLGSSLSKEVHHLLFICSLFLCSNCCLLSPPRFVTC